MPLLPVPLREYEDGYYRDRESWPDFRIEVEAILGSICPSPPYRVLEVGCGGGELLRRLGPRVRLAAGVDLSMAALRLARRGPARSGSDAGGIPLFCARAESLPFADGSFDALVAQHLVEHLPDPLAALREWRRVLRAGGTLAVVTPNAAYPDTSHFHDPSHATLFTPRSLRSALAGAGFQVDRLFTLFPYLGRGRLARAASIRLARLARHIPILGRSGRSLVAAATVPPRRLS